jgi:hypothetical protein
VWSIQKLFDAASGFVVINGVWKRRREGVWVMKKTRMKEADEG